jgi:3-hydroxyisobutyrate dehydrogenase-like beta-hydroxyacid dehydrogenase
MLRFGTVLLGSRALAKAKPGVIHVVMSTISVAFARELVTQHRQVGVDFVSAPVLGRPNVAALGELNIIGVVPPKESTRLGRSLPSRTR